MQYMYKPGARIRVPAQVAGEICEKLSEENNLTPEALLDVSRAEDAPLHRAFEWDDSVAAEEYRKGQAATIIRALAIIPEEKPEVIVRAFVRATSEPKEFVPYRKAISSDEGRRIMLRTALNELKAFRYKYQAIAELASINSAIGSVLEENAS